MLAKDTKGYCSLPPVVEEEENQKLYSNKIICPSWANFTFF